MNKIVKLTKKIYLFLILLSCAHHNNNNKADIIFLRNITAMFFVYWITINLFIALVFPDSFVYRYIKNFVIGSSAFLPISIFILNALLIRKYDVIKYYKTLLKYPELRNKLKLQFYFLYLGIFVFLMCMLYYYAE